MPRRSNEHGSSHIPYAPPEEMGDAELGEQIDLMKNSSLSPRKGALRAERLQRRIARVGLDEAEIMLGIVPEEGICD